MGFEAKKSYGYRQRPSIVKKAEKRAGKDKKKMASVVGELVEQYAIGNDLTTADALKKLREELKKDKSEGSYYYGWQSNIAMAFYDQFMNDFEGTLSQRQLSEVANKSAKRFLDSLIS